MAIMTMAITSVRRVVPFPAARAVKWLTCITLTLETGDIITPQDTSLRLAGMIPRRPAL